MKAKFIFLIFFLLFTLQSVNFCDVINVNKSASLKNIVSESNPNDTLIIDGGIYNEDSIIITKPLTILGKNNPDIKGLNRFHIVVVKSPGVTISGLTISNSGISYVQDRAGIKLDSVSDCRITNNKIINCMFALHISASNYCTISKNEITGSSLSESSSGNGVHLWYCNNIIINGNVIKNQRDGIYLEFVTFSKITNNISTENLRYGLHFMFSNNAEYTDNTFRSNGSGVAVMYTHNVTMLRNRFVNNWGSSANGILLKDISKSFIINNLFEHNTSGIFMEGGGSNTITRNKFRHNAWAIRLMANSQRNNLSENSFFGNTFDVSTNSTSNANTFIHNYWDKYTGYDINHDGKGDIPYHPVRLFAYLVEVNPPFLILLHSFFVQLLDMAENIIPTITPATLFDSQPLMSPLI